MSGIASTFPLWIDPANLPGFHIYGQFGWQSATKGAITPALDINIQ